MTSTYDIYSNIIKSYPVLSKVEERAMIAQWRHDEDKLRELLVLHNLRSAISLGSVYYAGVLGADEAVRYAVIGLVKAAQEFDINREDVKFITFAVLVMKSTISKSALSKNSLIAYLSSSMNAPVQNKKGDASEMTMGDLLIKNAAVGYDGLTNIVAQDIIRDTVKEDIKLIFDIIDRLAVPLRNKNVTKYYFNLTESGFDGDDPHTLKATGAVFEISQTSVLNIVKEVLKLVREKLLKEHSHEEMVNVHNSKNKCARRSFRNNSYIYRRIREECLSDKGSLRKPKKLSICYYGGGDGVFYSDRYMIISKKMSDYSYQKLTEKNQTTPSEVSDGLIFEDSEESVVNEFVQEAKAERVKFERKLLESDAIAFCVGSIEDDGDQDYECDD